MTYPLPLQERVLRTFTTLYSLRPDRGGALIVAVGLNPQGAALAFASNIAGAVCLSLEDNPDHIKDAIRSGACDFIVKTLDEALRTIKNEIRKHRPLSVGLQANPAAVLPELLDRGVSPQLFTDLSVTGPSFTSHSAAAEAAARFELLGASILNFSPAHSHPSAISTAISTTIHAEPQLESYLQQRNWHLASFDFESPSALRAFDASALALLPESDHLRRTWLRAAPKLLQRERPLRRLLWLSSDEEQTLISKPDSEDDSESEDEAQKINS